MKIRKVNEVQDVPITIEDTKTGKDLKNAYLEKIGKKDAKIRLFCTGQELSNTKFLYKYGLDNNYVVICYLPKQ